MKKIFTYSLIIFLTTSLFAENNQTKEMSKEDVDKWFEEYMVLEEEGKKIEKRLLEAKAKGKKLRKLNNTLDELTNMLGVKK